MKESIKAPRHWPLCGEFTGDRWIPCIKGQLRGKWFHLMTSSWSIISASLKNTRAKSFPHLSGTTELILSFITKSTKDRKLPETIFFISPALERFLFISKMERKCVPFWFCKMSTILYTLVCFTDLLATERYARGPCNRLCLHQRCKHCHWEDMRALVSEAGVNGGVTKWLHPT